MENDVIVFPCCGTRAWIKRGIESFFWSLRRNKFCPSCGHKNVHHIPVHGGV